MRFAIIGFPKCGTVSLEAFLAARYPDASVRRPELIWRRDGVRVFEREYASQGYVPVLITRDPVDACWSMYWYHYRARHQGSFESFLDRRGYRLPFGELNPILCYQFDQWIERYSKFDPLVYSLEKIRKERDFPVRNRTVDARPSNLPAGRPEMPALPEHLRRLTLQRLADEPRVEARRN